MMRFEDFAPKNGFSEKFLNKPEPFRQERWDNSSDETPSFMEKEFYTLKHHSFPFPPTICRKQFGP